MQISCWNTFSMKEGVSGFWKLGPLMLWIKRFSNEWKVVWYSKDDPLDYSFETSVPYEEDIPVDDVNINRYGLKKTSDTVIFSPSLADRPVVARPETPLYVPSDEQVTLYISTPLWVQVERGR